MHKYISCMAETGTAKDCVLVPCPQPKQCHCIGLGSQSRHSIWAEHMGIRVTSKPGTLYRSIACNMPCGNTLTTGGTRPHVQQQNLYTLNLYLLDGQHRVVAPLPCQGIRASAVKNDVFVLIDGARWQVYFGMPPVSFSPPQLRAINERPGSCHMQATV